MRYIVKDTDLARALTVHWKSLGVDVTVTRMAELYVLSGSHPMWREICDAFAAGFVVARC